MSDLVPAGFWRRLGSWWADRLIGLVVWAICAMWLVLALWAARGLPRHLPGAAVLALALLLMGGALHVAHQIAFVGGCGQTPGQMAAGIAVVRRDGAPAGYGRAAARSLAGLLTLLTFGLAAALVFFNRDRRGLGDLAAGTRLVRLAPAHADARNDRSLTRRAPETLSRPGLGMSHS